MGVDFSVGESRVTGMANPDTNSTITTISITIARADLSHELGRVVTDEVADEVAEAVTDALERLYPEAEVEVSISSDALETQIHAMAGPLFVMRGDWPYLYLQDEIGEAVDASLEASLEAS